MTARMNPVNCIQETEQLLLNKRKRVEKNADKQGSWARIRLDES